MLERVQMPIFLSSLAPRVVGPEKGSIPVDSLGSLQ